MPAALLEVLDAGHDDDLACIVARVRSLADAVRLVGTCSRFRAVADYVVVVNEVRTSVALRIERCRTALATLAETLGGNGGAYLRDALRDRYMPTRLLLGAMGIDGTGATAIKVYVNGPEPLDIV